MERDPKLVDYMARANELVTLAIAEDWELIHLRLEALDDADWAFLTIALLGFASAAYSEKAVQNLGLQIAELQT